MPIWRRRRSPTAMRAGCSATGRSRHASSASARRSTTRSEEHTSELQSLMRILYTVFCLKKKLQALYSSKTVRFHYEQTKYCNSEQYAYTMKKHLRTQSNKK